MQDVMLPLIRKAELVHLTVNVAKTGLSMGDAAEVALIDAYQIGVFATVRCRKLGLIPYRARRMLGLLGPSASEVILPSLIHGDHLRVRIVGLTPEHLAASGKPEVHVSIWGDPARILAVRSDEVLVSDQEANAEPSTSRS
jgi:hypothetical protein